MWRRRTMPYLCSSVYRSRLDTAPSPASGKYRCYRGQSRLPTRCCYFHRPGHPVIFTAPVMLLLSQPQGCCCIHHPNDAVTFNALMKLLHSPPWRWLNLLLPFCRYFDSLHSIFQPRFEFVFHQHIHSIQTCDIQKLGQVDLQPHFISRRYAEMCAAIIALNEGTDNDQAVRYSLGNALWI